MLSIAIKLGCVLILGFSSQQALADEPWELVSSEHGLKVFRKEMKGTDLIAFKGVKIMAAPLTKVAQVIMDENPTRKKAWVDRIKDFKVLENDPRNSVVYLSYEFPWPISNRDFVINSKLMVDKAKNQVIFNLRSVENSKTPETVGVRAELTRGVYKLIPMSANQTEVTVEILSDPKGYLPKWLVNLIQKSWPANTLRKLEEEAIRKETIENPIIKAEFRGTRKLIKH